MNERRYVRNPGGQIHSVSEEDFTERLHVQAEGRSYLRPGWAEVDEATARKEVPGEFGVPDPDVTAMQTPEDLQRTLQRKRVIDELNGGGGR